MWRSYLGVIIGLTIGTAIGVGLAIGLLCLFPSNVGWTSYITPGQEPYVPPGMPDPRQDQYLLYGAIFGAGFGALIGGIVGSAAGLMCAIKDVCKLLVLESGRRRPSSE